MVLLEQLPHHGALELEYDCSPQSCVGMSALYSMHVFALKIS